MNSLGLFNNMDYSLRLILLDFMLSGATQNHIFILKWLNSNKTWHVVCMCYVLLYNHVLTLTIMVLLARKVEGDIKNQNMYLYIWQF